VASEVKSKQCFTSMKNNDNIYVILHGNHQSMYQIRAISTTPNFKLILPNSCLMSGNLKKTIRCLWTRSFSYSVYGYSPYV